MHTPEHPSPLELSSVPPARCRRHALRSAAGFCGLPVLRLFFLGLVISLRHLNAADTHSPPPTPLYESRPGSFDGIGKWFLGREIAHFMSHQGAMWLERPEREDEEQPTQLLDALKLKPGEVVADIGAGSGFLTWRMAKRVGPTGRVYANDIQPEMLAILRTNVAGHGVTNVVPVLGKVTDPQLPTNAIDLAIFVDVYHECDHPYEMIQALCSALKPGGRLVFVEYRGEEKWIPIKPLHKMTEAQVKQEMTLHPLSWVETLRFLPRQHVLIFRRRTD